MILSGAYNSETCNSETSIDANPPNMQHSDRQHLCTSSMRTSPCQGKYRSQLDLRGHNGDKISSRSMAHSSRSHQEAVAQVMKLAHGSTCPSSGGICRYMVAALPLKRHSRSSRLFTSVRGKAVENIPWKPWDPPWEFVEDATHLQNGADARKAPYFARFQNSVR